MLGHVFLKNGFLNPKHTLTSGEKIFWKKLFFVEVSNTSYFRNEWRFEDFCIADMLKDKEGNLFINDCLRNLNTFECLRIRESIDDLNFNYGEFAAIKSKSG